MIRGQAVVVQRAVDEGWSDARAFGRVPVLAALERALSHVDGELETAGGARPSVARRLLEERSAILRRVVDAREWPEVQDPVVVGYLSGRNGASRLHARSTLARHLEEVARLEDALSRRLAAPVLVDDGEHGSTPGWCFSVVRSCSAWAEAFGRQPLPPVGLRPWKWEAGVVAWSRRDPADGFGMPVAPAHRACSPGWHWAEFDERRDVRGVPWQSLVPERAR